ncbi:hypothetical protein PQX77_022032 [Marasmius sp. AFHP31]|nr:hypothetical protein PQX77_022032 [Marasmius sp. AFHP31]
MAAYPIQTQNLLINMLDLQKYFGKNLFNGRDFLQVYEPAMEGVSKAEGLWENLTGEDKDIPPPEDTVTTETVGSGPQAATRDVTTPPTELEIAEWNAKHAPWKKDSNMLMLQIAPLFLLFPWSPDYYP